MLAGEMDQRVEAPNQSDIDRIARMIIEADQLAQDIIAQQLDGSLDDLNRLQMMLDSGTIEPEATRPLQCLGIAFGKVFVENNQNYDWWMVEDEYGRDPCVRYRQTSLMTFPQTMLSKRVEDREEVDVADLYSGLIRQLDDIRAEHFPDD